MINKDSVIKWRSDNQHNGLGLGIIISIVNLSEETRKYIIYTGQKEKRFYPLLCPN
jgi:hypothetical protein